MYQHGRVSLYMVWTIAGYRGWAHGLYRQRPTASILAGGETPGRSM